MDVIEMCAGDNYCMERATREAKILIEAGGRAFVRKVRLCPRHLAVMQEHAKRRCAKDPTLTIRFDVGEIEGGKG